MIRSTMFDPALAPLLVAFCQLWVATTRGHGSPSHHPDIGPPDWPGAALATIITELYLVVLHWRTLSRLAAREATSPSVVAAAT